MDELNKIYVEPTNRCNLDLCDLHPQLVGRTVRGYGLVRYIEALIDGLADFPGPKTIAFAGLGEPLLHEKFPEMVRLAHERGLRTEMTSNAMLLTPSLAGQTRSRPVSTSSRSPSTGRRTSPTGPSGRGPPWRQITSQCPEGSTG